VKEVSLLFHCRFDMYRADGTRFGLPGPAPE